MDLELAGKVALVTGASSGIGRATSIRLAAEGMKVMLVSRNEARLAEVVQSIRQAGGEAEASAGDVRDEAFLERPVQAALGAFGRLDVLVNAAGHIASGTIENTSLQEWDRMMEINVRAVFRLMQLAVPHLLQTRGAIVNVSSVTGTRSFPGVLAYCVAKAAVDQLTRCAALELAPKGVRVNAVNPGVVVTELHRRSGMDDAKYAAFLEHSKTTHPMGRVGRPEEIAELIAFLVSPRAGWVTGTTNNIDGGRALTCAR